MQEEYNSENKEIIGPRLFEQLRNQVQKIEEMTVDDFIKCLLKTTVHEIYPERNNNKHMKEKGAQEANSDWNNKEYSLLQKTPKVVRRVTPLTKETFDKYPLTDEQKTSESESLDLMLIYGPILTQTNPKDFQRFFYDPNGSLLNELKSFDKKTDAEQKDFIKRAMLQFKKEEYQEFFEEQLLPEMLKRCKEKKDFIFTTPAVGCQAYAGPFGEEMKKHYINMLEQFIQKNHGKLPNLKGVVLTGMREYNKQEIIGTIPFIVTPKGIGFAPRLDEDIQKIIPNYKQCKVLGGVAGDPLSNPANEWNKAKRGSHEEVAFALTDGMKQFTGIEGRVVSDKGKITGYNPPKKEKCSNNWSLHYEEGTNVNEILVNDTNNVAKNFLDNLQKILEDEKYLLSSTFFGSKTLKEYQRILQTHEIAPDEKVSQIIQLAYEATEKRQQSGSLEKFFKYSGEREKISKLHEDIANAMKDIPHATENLKTGIRKEIDDFKQKQSNLKQELNDNVGAIKNNQDNEDDQHLDVNLNH